MKISLALTAVIIAAALALGWSDRREMTELRTEHRKLVSEAEALGIATSDKPGEQEAAAKRRVHRDRGTREAEAAEVRAVTRELVDLILEVKRLQESGEPMPGPEIQAQMMETIARVLELNAAQLKTLIAEIRNVPELDEETRGELTGFAIMMLANDHPQVALALFSEASDLLTDVRMKNHLVPAALARWAQDDPLAALDWFQQHGKDIEMPDHAKNAMVGAMVKSDPDHALQLIGELKLDPGNALATLVGSAGNDEERTQLLAKARDYLAKLPEQDRRKAETSAYSRLGTQLSQGNFESAARWLAEADLDDTEKSAFANGIHANLIDGKTDRWIGWVAENLPPEEAAEKISGLVQGWTRKDYVAAGTWLAAQPDGPTKAAAVASFAETVGPHDPESAANWAKTLPAEKRREILHKVHRQIPDPAAAEAFASRHGIE